MCVFVCGIMSLPHGGIGLSVILAIPGHTHFIIMIIIVATLKPDLAILLNLT